MHAFLSAKKNLQISSSSNVWDRAPKATQSKITNWIPMWIKPVISWLASPNAEITSRTRWSTLLTFTPTECTATSPNQIPTFIVTNSTSVRTVISHAVHALAGQVTIAKPALSSIYMKRNVYHLVLQT